MKAAVIYHDVLHDTSEDQISEDQYRCIGARGRRPHCEKGAGTQANHMGWKRAVALCPVDGWMVLIAFAGGEIQRVIRTGFLNGRPRPALGLQRATDAKTAIDRIGRSWRCPQTSGATSRTPSSREPVTGVRPCSAFLSKSSGLSESHSVGPDKLAISKERRFERMPHLAPTPAV